MLIVLEEGGVQHGGGTWYAVFSGWVMYLAPWLGRYMATISYVWYEGIPLVLMIRIEQQRHASEPLSDPFPTKPMRVALFMQVESISIPFPLQKAKNSVWLAL